MELRQLKYFVSAAKHLNFTKAARECFIVQSSMTAQIASLEEELGVKLFERRSRGLALTEAGEFFLPKIRSLVQSMETLETDAKIFRSGYTSVLKIGFHGEIFKQDLIEALKVFHQCMPQVKVELVQLSELKMLEDLHEGLLDIICIPHLDAFTTEKWLEVQKLCEIAPILVVSKNHPIASKDSVRMEEISQLELIRFVDGDQMNWDNDLEAFEEKPRIYDTVSDHTSCEILLSSGYGVGMWSEKFSKKGHYPDLKFIKIEGFPCKYSCAIAWKKDKLTIAGEKFCELFKNQFNDSDIL